MSNKGQSGLYKKTEYNEQSNPFGTPDYFSNPGTLRVDLDLENIQVEEFTSNKNSGLSKG